MAKEKDELKGLPPEERIKKLKDIEKQKKKEIEEAHQLLRESEDELTARRKWKDRVPIPEVAKDELENMSEEGRELLKLHKGLRSPRGKEEIKEEEGPPSRKKSKGLEETIEQEKISAPPGAAGMKYDITKQPGFGVAYAGKPMHDLPTQEILRRLDSYQNLIEERGYITKTEADFAYSARSEIADRMESGYSWSKKAAEAASLIQQGSSRLLRGYRGQNESAPEHDYNAGR